MNLSALCFVFGTDKFSTCQHNQPTRAYNTDGWFPCPQHPIHQEHIRVSAGNSLYTLTGSHLSSLCNWTLMLDSLQNSPPLCPQRPRHQEHNRASECRQQLAHSQEVISAVSLNTNGWLLTKQVSAHPLPSADTCQEEWWQTCGTLPGRPPNSVPK